MAARQEEQLEATVKFSPPLYIQRYTAVKELLLNQENEIKKVVDFGCAEGKFIKFLKNIPSVKEIALVDLDENDLESAGYKARPISWDSLFKRVVPLDIKIYKGSVSEMDSALEDYDAVTAIELIEHLDADILEKLPLNIFGFIKPKIAIFTTPNFEFNVLFQKTTKLRHWDHRFEWTREEFKDWASMVLKMYPEYEVEFTGVGSPPEDQASLGCCSQIAIFRLKKDFCKKALVCEPKSSYTNLETIEYPRKLDSEV